MIQNQTQKPGDLKDSQKKNDGNNPNKSNNTSNTGSSSNIAPATPKLFIATIIILLIAIGTTAFGVIYNFVLYKKLAQQSENIQQNSNDFINYTKFENDRYEKLEQKLITMQTDIIDSLTTKISKAIDERMPNEDLAFLKLRVFEAINILEQAYLNLHYWDNKEKALALLHNAMTSLKTLESAANITTIIPDIKNIISKLDILIGDVNRITYLSNQHLLNSLAIIGQAIAKLDSKNFTTGEEATTNGENSAKAENTATSQQSTINRLQSFWKSKVHDIYQETKSYLKIQNKHDRDAVFNRLNNGVIKEEMLLKLDEIKFAIISTNNALYSIKIQELSNMLSHLNIPKQGEIPDLIAYLTSVSINNPEFPLLEEIIHSLYQQVGK